MGDLLRQIKSNRVTRKAKKGWNHRFVLMIREFWSRRISPRLRRYWYYFWIRKGVLLGYLTLGAVVAFSVLEWRGDLNLIPANGSSELVQLAPVIGAFGSVALTFGLLILYSRQTAVLEQQYKPNLTGEIDVRSSVTSQFVVRNTGADFAYDIEAEWSIAGETKVWETPRSLGPGDSAAFPIVVDEDGSWILHTRQLKEFFEENDVSSVIEYEIRCKDQFGIPRKYRGSVDFGLMINREESNEILDNEPLESIADSIASIQASIETISSNIDDRRDEEEWQDRWSKQQAIINIVEEQGEVPIHVLSRIISTREGTLEYRLSELEEAGYLYYDENEGVIKNKMGPRENQTLSDFT